MDQPILCLLELKEDVLVVANAIPRDEFGLYRSSFFGAEISKQQWRNYLLENNDLRFLFKFPDYKRWFVFDFSEIKNRHVALNPVALSDVEEEWFPGAGLFSRHHTEDIEMPEKATYEQRFYLDPI